MITDTLINTIVASSITGAGLIFVAYSILIPFCEKLKQFRERRIAEKRKLINKKASTVKLKEVIEDVERSEAQPFYLSAVVYLIFIFYISSTLIGLFYLTSPNQQTIQNLAQACVWLFGIATGLFGWMGITLLSDILDFMRNYLNLKEQEDA